MAFLLSTIIFLTVPIVVIFLGLGLCSISFFLFKNEKEVKICWCCKKELTSNDNLDSIKPVCGKCDHSIGLSPFS